MRIGNTTVHKNVMTLFSVVACAVIGALVPVSLAGPLQVRADHTGIPGDATFDYVGMLASTAYHLSDAYLFLVIGGGTAGLTIAARLAEFASVAVIEGESICS